MSASGYRNQAPEAPTDLSFSIVDGQSLLQWNNPNPVAISYQEIWTAPLDDPTAFALCSQVSGPVSSFVVPAPGEFKVRSCNQFGASDFSNTVEVSAEIVG
jgi:hypothetical protein